MEYSINTLGYEHQKDQKQSDKVKRRSRAVLKDSSSSDLHRRERPHFTMKSFPTANNF